MSGESEEDIQKKLTEYKDQLAQVNALLQLSPNDDALIKLRGDLIQLVALTEDLSKMKGLPPPLPPSSSDAYGSEQKWKVGDRCEALWDDGKYYIAQIDGIDDLGDYQVTYMDYGTTGTVPESSLKIYRPAPPASLKNGTPVKAVWQGMFYPGICHGPGKLLDSYIVKFSKYKTKKEIHAYDIVLREEDKPAIDVNSDELVIPESLSILPTDTEAIKEAKRKKIKRLKNLHRKRKLEEEGEKKQSSWQTFQKKGRGAGAQLLKKKKSIFASPDSVEGRVGVTGSGKALTSFAETRTKHVHALPGDDPDDLEDE